MPTERFAFRRLAGASLAVLVLGLGISACGGGDESDETAAPVTTTTPAETATITQDELISQGDEICAEANSALGAIESSTADETTKSTQISDIYDGVAQQLGELGTPSDGEPPTDVIAAIQDLADGGTDTTALQSAATEYGFTDCGEAPEATSYPTTSTGTESESSTGTDSTETYTPPTTTPEETYTPPAPTTPDTGGGVAPTTPTTPSTGGSSGSASSGGIGPG